MCFGSWKTYSLEGIGDIGACFNGWGTGFSSTRWSTGAGGFMRAPTPNGTPYCAHSCTCVQSVQRQRPLHSHTSLTQIACVIQPTIIFGNVWTQGFQVSLTGKGAFWEANGEEQRRAYLLEIGARDNSISLPRKIHEPHALRGTNMREEMGIDWDRCTGTCEGDDFLWFWNNKPVELGGALEAQVFLSL